MTVAQLLPTDLGLALIALLLVVDVVAFGSMLFEVFMLARNWIEWRRYGR